MKKIFIKTFGCQMNTYDSERMAGELAAAGYELAADEHASEYVIINTCSVRQHAEDRAMSYIGAAIKTKKVIVAGCMAERMKQELIDKFPRLHAVVGTFNFSNIAEVIERKRSKLYTDSINERYTKNLKRTDRFRAAVAVMQGCNNFCSYCIVPYVRGSERSRTAEEIMQEVRVLAGEGFKEVTLLGQNVNSFFDDMSGLNFAWLLRRVAEVKGIEFVRFMTSHPKDLSDALITAVKETPNACRHIHLPMQSGSDRVLEMMNRKYTSGWYSGRVDKIREIMPDCSVTSDILVGFPGETQEDFNATLAMVERSRFDYAYIFKYSPRKGTKAERMADDVPDNEKLRRLNIILEMQKKISEDITKKYLGTTVRALVYGLSRWEAGHAEASAGSSKKILIKGGNELLGVSADIKITGAKGAMLSGEIIR
jgi:tRNA-2-methylthio-N6-dimethylallyladenosine synthase